VKGPPPDVDPSALFLTISEWRPRQAIAARLDAAPDVPLFAQAATSAALARAASPGAQVAICLVTEAGEPVLTAEMVGLLGATEWRALHRDVSAALARICPLIGSPGEGAWIDALKLGARGQRAIVSQMRTCFDLTPLSKLVLTPRPDRFFGRPACEVLDGHLLMFRALKELLLPN
jgi:hypothetical protein